MTYTTCVVIDYSVFTTDAREHTDLLEAFMAFLSQVSVPEFLFCSCTLLFKIAVDFVICMEHLSCCIDDRLR